MSIAERSAMTNSSSILGKLHLAIPVGVMGILLVMVLPMPTMIMDLLISLNITLSIVIMLVSMYILQPVHFSVFPSLLLLITLFRLSINVATTRLILLQGATGEDAAGKVIQSFGQFVVGGNYVVGIVVFLVLIAIQYIVINHGAVRISEVTARFTLDAMPGKQMSIDADVNAGVINETEARQRREQISKEAEFYGAMDGAIRFTSRDAIASIIILSINIIGGFLIGVLQFDMELADAAKRFTILTIGDGLVTAIPSLLVSVAGAIITTRAASESNLGEDVARQLFVNPIPIAIGSGFLFFLALVPGLPFVPFFVLGSLTGLLAYRRRNEQRSENLALERIKTEKAEADKAQGQGGRAPEDRPSWD